MRSDASRERRVYTRKKEAAGITRKIDELLEMLQWYEKWMADDYEWWGETKCVLSEFLHPFAGFAWGPRVWVVCTVWNWLLKSPPGQEDFVRVSRWKADINRTVSTRGVIVSYTTRSKSSLCYFEIVSHELIIFRVEERVAVIGGCCDIFSLGVFLFSFLYVHAVRRFRFIRIYIR